MIFGNRLDRVVFLLNIYVTSFIMIMGCDIIGILFIDGDLIFTCRSGIYF